MNINPQLLIEKEANLTALNIAKELSDLGLNDKAALKFLRRLESIEKRQISSKLTYDYLNDLNTDNVIDNLNKILYYIILEKRNNYK